MKVLITGINGYIGTQMAPFLQSRGHSVFGFDTGYYQEGRLYEQDGFGKLNIIQKDTRQADYDDFKGFEAVIHLADLSNDPLGHLDPELTYDINLRAAVRLAENAKKAGVKRFIYSSSCSVYGLASEEMVNEKSVVNPQTAYAESKVKVEKELIRLGDGEFSPTIMRNATVFGASPRMRFDLVVNNLAGLAWTKKHIKMTSDGTPWRPLVHIMDVCEAFSQVLEAPLETVHNQILNVGATDGNYRIKEVAEIIGRVFTGCTISLGNSDGDTRSYKVNFDKIKKVLPDFNPKRMVEDGAMELKTIFESINMTYEIFESRLYTRLKQIEHLKNTNRINEKFFWN